MNSRKATWILGIAAIAVAGFVLMAGTKVSQAAAAQANAPRQSKSRSITSALGL